MSNEQDDTTRLLLIPDHRDRMIGKIPSQFRQGPRWQAFMAAAGLGVQTMEDLFFDLIVSRTLPSSKGAQLDQWGDLVGEPRAGLPDDEYRPFISARIFANGATGTTDDFVFILLTTTEPSTVEHRQVFPACAAFEILRAEFMTEPRRRKVARLMEDVRPAGVCFQIVEASASPFGFLGAPTALGFNEGLFARIL